MRIDKIGARVKFVKSVEFVKFGGRRSVGEESGIGEPEGVGYLPKDRFGVSLEGRCENTKTPATAEVLCLMHQQGFEPWTR